MLHHISAQSTPGSTPVFTIPQDDRAEPEGPPTGAFLTVAEIRERYPANILLAIEAQGTPDEPPTFPDFMQLTTEQQHAVVRAITGHQPVIDLRKFAIYPSQPTDTVTMYDLVAQRILTTGLHAPETVAHWLNQVQQQGYPEAHPLYETLGLNPGHIADIMRNWPELPQTKRRDLDWHHQHLLQVLRHLQVAIYASRHEKLILAARLQANNVAVTQLDERPHVIVTNSDPYDNNVFVSALKAASQANIPLYIAQASDQASDEHAQRLRVAEQVLHEVRTVYQGQPVEHAFAEVQATLASIINTSSQPKQQETLF